MKDVSVIDLPIEPTKRWGETPLFNIQDSFDLIAFCEKNNMAILGLEGFMLSGNKRVPDMNCIIDFSELRENLGSAFPSRSIEITKSFLHRIQNRNIYLEFTLVQA